MVIDEKIELSANCAITASYISDMRPELAIEYFERFDNGQTETIVDINKEKAIEIIEFLSMHFKL